MSEQILEMLGWLRQYVRLPSASRRLTGLEFKVTKYEIPSLYYGTTMAKTQQQQQLQNQHQHQHQLQYDATNSNTNYVYFKF